ncbi:hypothetical protein BR63_05645 [Thermanaerosceptrum fracticalcis]|uniref:Uncharacterized protein n=1 Tax=Thermanaerosceptrum fracticalcis TaxID=1712410 RepID=A0A7G6E188_THEFR|nr:hypothetical protein [Thermanaerosceptrum fracticalcis]QNB45842.1 hypothetical protein BR63_05645 [Thermanaerosceptrum fracticalcis]
MAYTSNITFLASAARTASGESGAMNLYDAEELLLFLNVKAASGTSPTLDVKVQAKSPEGDWYDLASFTQATAAKKEAKAISGFGQDVRISYTIGGTSPSFTFAVTGIAKHRN